MNNLDLTPVIFLHGLCGSRTSQSGSCRDMASQGFIVFSIDHHDGSAYYSKRRDGNERIYDNIGFTDAKIRRDQLVIREAEVIELIDDIYEEDFMLRHGFGANTVLNLDKLILGGHSFGGMTAI